MILNILYDANWETKIDHAVKVIDTSAMSDREYGNGIAKVLVILNCRDPHLAHKQRVRFVKKERTFYVDVMLDHREFVRSTHVLRRQRIHEELLKQLGSVFRQRKFQDFAFEEFIADLDSHLNEQMNGPESRRFDANCLEVASGH